MRKVITLSFVFVLFFVSCDMKEHKDDSSDSDLIENLGDKDSEPDDNDINNSEVATDDEPEHPMGRVFEITPDLGDSVDVLLSGLPENADKLEGDSFVIYSCTGEECFSDIEQLAAADEAGDFLFNPLLDPDLGPDPAAEVNTYFHLERFLTNFKNLGFTGFNRQINIILNFSYDFDYDGQNDDFLAGATDVMGYPGLLIGTWDKRNLAYDPDIFGHELTHLVTAAVNPLDLSLVKTGFSLPAGAVSEGTADYFSCSFMGDPDVGEYTATALGLPFLSSVDNSSICPDDLIGEAHVDGQIWSATLWEIRGAVGSEAADQAIYRTVSALSLGFSFPEAIETLLKELEPLLSQSEYEHVTTIIQKRGLDSCEPVKHIESGPTEIFIPSVYTEIWNEDHSDILSIDCVPTALQIVIPVSAQTSNLEIGIDIPSDELIEYDDMTVYFRFDEPVEYKLEENSLVADSDGFFPATNVISLNTESLPPLQEGELYLSICHSGDEDGSVEITVE